MTAAIRKTPLQQGREYRDRRGRTWRVSRLANAGRSVFHATLPALALVTCIDPNAHGDPDTRFPQWVETDTGRWSGEYQTALDLVSPA